MGLPLRPVLLQRGDHTYGYLQDKHLKANHKPQLICLIKVEAHLASNYQPNRHTEGCLMHGQKECLHAKRGLRIFHKSLLLLL